MALKKMQKRMLAAALGVLMGLSVVGCGQTPSADSGKNSETAGATESTGEETKTTEGTTDEKDPLGKYEDTVTFTLASQLMESFNTSDNATPEKNAYRDYIKEMLNVEYEYEIESYDGGDYQTQISLAITSGELPDVMFLADYNQLREMAENDMLEDLTDVYNEYASDSLKDVYASYPDNKFDKVTFDGKIVALPRASMQPEDLVWIRQDWLDQLGIKLDEDGDHLITRDDLEMVAKAFVEADPGNTGNPVGFAITSLTDKGATSSPTDVNTSFGVFQRNYWKADDGSIYYGSNTPEMKEALTWWADMYQKGLLDPQYGIRDLGGGVELVVNGQSGIYFGEVGTPAWYSSGAMDNDPNADFTPFAIDNGTGKTVTATYDMINRYVAVRKGYEHPEVVVKLENLYRSVVENPNLEEENPQLYNYYQTGTLPDIDPLRLANDKSDALAAPVVIANDYVAGKISKDEIKDTKALTVIDLIDRYNEDPTSLSGAEKGTYIFYMKGMNAIMDMKNSGVLEYVTPVYAPTTETMKTKQADIDKLEEQALVKIITGEEPVDYFDTYVEEWNERGGAQILKEIEEAVN